MLLPQPYESCVPRSSSLPSPYDPIPNEAATRCARVSASVPTGGDGDSGCTPEKSVLAPPSRLKPGDRNHSKPNAASTTDWPPTLSESVEDVEVAAPAATTVLAVVTPALASDVSGR